MRATFYQSLNKFLLAVAIGAAMFLGNVIPVMAQFGNGMSVEEIMNYDDPWMKSFKGKTGVEGMTREMAIAAFEAMIKGDFGSDAFKAALFAFLSDPVWSQKYDSTNPQELVRGIGDMLNTTYPDAYNAAWENVIAAGAPVNPDMLATNILRGEELTAEQKAALSSTVQEVAPLALTAVAIREGNKDPQGAARKWKDTMGVVDDENRDEFIKYAQENGDVYYNGMLYKKWNGTAASSIVDTDAMNLLNGNSVLLDDSNACDDAFGKGPLSFTGGKSGKGSGGGGEGGGGEGGGGEGGGGEGEGGGGEPVQCKQEGGACSSNNNCCTDLYCASGTCKKSPVACTAYTYSNWGTCTQAGKQTRTIVTQSPNGCNDTASASLSQSCTAEVEPKMTNTTNAVQKTANPVISMTSDRACNCQYSKTSGFKYTEGTTFDTTGGYNHNATLSNLNNGKHTYYALCKDNSTGGINKEFKIEFEVAISAEPGAPAVVSTTPAKQTSQAAALSVTTDRPATCQYKNASFVYGAGSAMGTADNYSHGVAISSLADGSYTFYVICKDKNSGATSAATQIATIIDRSGLNPGEPAITNNTAGYQTVSNPTLAVLTAKAATCQYKENAAFAYGNGLQFTTDGDTSHSVQLANVGDGAHTYYVVCKDAASGAANTNAYQVIFTVKTQGGGTQCANLNSNDRKNDRGRSYSGNTEANSFYPWQGVELGTRDKFPKVDWYAGYQFTPNKDGKITQLCGYFDKNVTNKVIIFDGSYAELASASITGSGGWKCENVAPLSVKTDKRYYVIARVVDNPIYFEYKSGLLPRNSGNIAIEAGIRQTVVDKKFMDQIVKYDYMIFGLVDFKISYATENTSGPQVTAAGPTGTISGPDAELSINTDQNATCRFDREDVDFYQMNYPLPKVSGDNFRRKVCGLEAGGYTFYVRCQSGGGEKNNASKEIKFEISQ